MKKLYSLIILFTTLAYSQSKEQAENKVTEGVEFHDLGNFEDALIKYDEALTLDKDNSYALAEKAMTLEAMKKYDEAIEICQKVLKLHPKENNAMVYVTYGNALDHFGKAKQALKVYDEGIKKFPNQYQLFFNKGITLINIKEREKALEAIQTATKLNPNHSSSFNALSILDSENRIPAILSLSRYLIIDNRTSRAKTNFDVLTLLMNQGVSKTGDNSISININEDLLNDGKKGENNFSSLDLMLSLAGAVDLSEENKDKTDVERFTSKFKTMCQGMAEMRKKQKGYYWEFLAPYFIEMNEKNLIEPFANIIFLSIKDISAQKYKEENPGKMEQFHFWSKNYIWK